MDKTQHGENIADNVEHRPQHSALYSLARTEKQNRGGEPVQQRQNEPTTHEWAVNQSRQTSNFKHKRNKTKRKAAKDNRLTAE